MPKTAGPCRFGQYNVLIKNVIEKMRYKDVAQISLTSENSYAGFGTAISLRAWQSIVIADVMEEIYSAVLAISKDKDSALGIYDSVCAKILASVEKDDWDGVKKTLREAAQELGRIEKIQTLAQTPKVALVGEIYVRRDGFSRQRLVERLAKEGIIVKTAPIAEWMYYCDYVLMNKYDVDSGIKDRFKTYMLQPFKISYEKAVKEIFSTTGLYEPHMIDVGKLIRNATGLISPNLTGEAILTSSSAITEIVEEVAGVISIGPFGCMPGRIAESIINTKMSEKKAEVAGDKELVAKVIERYPSLPFLAVETDGNAFPQVIEARLEVFCLQAHRIHDMVMEINGV